MPLIDIKSISRRFGGLAAVSNVDLRIAEGEIHCLIGPNGAGKSTLFKLIVGVYEPSAGTIMFDNVDITRERPYARVQRGMSIKMQAPSVFKELPVRQNLDIALQRQRSGDELAMERQRLLELLDLAEHADKAAGGANIAVPALLHGGFERASFDPI